MSMDSSCKHTSRTKPSLHVDKEKAEEIAKNYRTMPLFESMLFNDVYTRHYSLKTNEYLGCRWEVYKDTMATRVHEPFKFYDKRDLHFYLCDARLIPSQSLHTKTDFRHKMTPGPGVDLKGQVPIPEELHVRKFCVVPRKYPKQYPKEPKDKKEK